MTHCEALFKDADADCSGEIDYNEFEEVLVRLKGEQIRKQAKAMFKMADLDGDRKLSLNEFIAITFDWKSLDVKLFDKELTKVISGLDRSGRGDGLLAKADLFRALQ